MDDTKTNFNKTNFNKTNFNKTNFNNLPIEMEDLIFLHTDFYTCFINKKYKLLKKLYRINVDTLFSTIVIDNLDILKYLITKFNVKPQKDNFLQAINYKRYDILKYLCENYTNLFEIQYLYHHEYCYKIFNDIRLFKIIHNAIENNLNQEDKCDLVDSACRLGNLEIIKLLYENDYDFDSMTMDMLCIHNKLDILKYLYYKNVEIKDSAMDYASIYGNLSILKFLHSININCSRNAIDYASKRGNLEIVKYLCSLNKPSSKAIDLASLNNHIDIVKFLLENKKTFSLETINHAKMLGYDNIVVLLFNNIHLGR